MGKTISEGGVLVPARVHEISVVIPVYQGAKTLPGVVHELARMREQFKTLEGHRAKVSEVVLVHDCGPDDSGRVIRDLAADDDWVVPVWLSRNFGQHAATLAGMACTGGDWVATLDEDGQHDPDSLPAMLDKALAARSDVVYASAVNDPPHGFLRNSASRLAKISVSRMTGNTEAVNFSSLRLVLGDIARSVAAYAGAGVYLDVALGWVASGTTSCDVYLREEGDRRSGYSFRSLLSHYWRMVLTGGTKLLRFVSLAGVLSATAGFAFAVYVVATHFWGSETPRGWSSVIVVLLMGTGAILFTLGVVAEYVGVAVNMAMGKPAYLIVGDRTKGPHGADPQSRT